MRAEYDFFGAKRGALLSSEGKTRITIYIDNAVPDEFRARAEQARTGYQTMMNDESQNELPLTAAQIALLEKRLAAYRENPKAGSSWEEVRARLERLT